jgi:acetylornithine deacetylase/succinyl-diaminopimelate desuccinylase-like protein
MDIASTTPKAVSLAAAVLLVAAACKRGSDAAEARSGLACDPTTPATLQTCVSREAYERELAFVAAPRPPRSPHHRAVQDLCAERFAAAGYEVERQAYGTGINVIGTLAGSEPALVVVSAHYDHIEG